MKHQNLLTTNWEKIERYIVNWELYIIVKYDHRINKYFAINISFINSNVWAFPELKYIGNPKLYS